jgi:hypothetical protein
MRKRTEHGLSRLTAISDAGSTPAASTINLFSFNNIYEKSAEKAMKISSAKSLIMNEIVKSIIRLY